MNRNSVILSALVCALSCVVHAKESKPLDVDMSIAGKPQAKMLDADLPAASTAQLKLNKFKLPAPAVTDEDVGDADSFGRYVKWLGVADSKWLNFYSDCTPDPDVPPAPGDRCIVLPAAPATLRYDERKLDTITLPPNSTNSLICQSVTPYLMYWYNNPTSTQQVGIVNFTPYWTVENDVLNDPSLIDPATGLPLGGKLEYSLSVTQGEYRQLQPGETAYQRLNFTRQCIGGILSKDMLMNSYGLSEAQAATFFQNKTVMTFHVRGNMRMVESASLYYGVRLLGD